jgi:hypothetical protein
MQQSVFTSNNTVVMVLYNNKRFYVDRSNMNCPFLCVWYLSGCAQARQDATSERDTWAQFFAASQNLRLGSGEQWHNGRRRGAWFAYCSAKVHLNAGASITRLWHTGPPEWSSRSY